MPGKKQMTLLDGEPSISCVKPFKIERENKITALDMTHISIQ